jgi:hypothetical protein
LQVAVNILNNNSEKLAVSSAVYRTSFKRHFHNVQISKFWWPKREVMQSGFCGNIVQNFDFHRAGRGIIVLSVVFAVKGKGMAGEPDFRVVLLQLGHFQDNRIMSQLRYEKFDFFAILFSF